MRHSVTGVSHRQSSFLLTGALTFDGDTSRDTEEIAPAVNAVKNDLLYMINHLKQ